MAPFARFQLGDGAKFTGMGITIEFADGRVGAMTTEGGAPPAGAKKRSVRPAEPPKQGSLF